MDGGPDGGWLGGEGLEGGLDGKGWMEGGVEAWKEVCVVDGGHAGLDRGGRDGGWKVGLKDWRAGWRVGWRGGWRVGWGWMELGWVAGDRTARTESVKTHPRNRDEPKQNAVLQLFALFVRTSKCYHADWAKVQLDKIEY